MGAGLPPPVSGGAVVGVVGVTTVGVVGVTGVVVVVLEVAVFTDEPAGEPTLPHLRKP
jgi:hypothetical protein